MTTLAKIHQELEHLVSQHPTARLGKKCIIVGNVTDDVTGGPLTALLSMDPDDYPSPEAYKNVLAQLEQARSQNAIISFAYVVECQELPNFRATPELAFMPAKAS